MKKITDDWLKSALSDLEIIDRIIDQNNLNHQVAFHAQQAVEKSFKAIIEEHELGFIKTHSLSTLFGKIQDILKIDIKADTLILLDQLYIDSRYPGELGLLPDGIPSENQVKEFSEFATSIFNSVKKQVF